MSASKSIPDPEVIAGRYAVESKLGAGAFGTVYKARDTVLGRMIAIKTIRLEGLAATGAGLDELLTRFRREAMVSAQLKHPNIVTIYDIGESEGMSYLAMEFIDGVGLERVIRDVGPFPVERAASIATQVADALDYAHRQSVVHRDIKPANVMLEAGDRVKVADFGIARVTTSADHLTATGSLLGTPSYMSPEQARGHELDGRSDLFSLGCVLYEMLAGRRAFRGDSITGLIFKVITEEPPALDQLRPDLPPELVAVVGRAMAKAADDRFQSGREMGQALAAFTSASSTPTLRQSETKTESVPPTTLSTLIPDETVSTAPTRASAPPTTRLSPPPPPTQATAPRAAGAPPAAKPRAGGTPRTAAASARRAGVSAGLLLGLAGGGAVALALALGAGWYFWRGPGTTPTTAEVQPVELPATPVPAGPPTVAPTTAAEPEPSPEARRSDPVAAPTTAPAATPAPATPAPRAAAATPEPRRSEAPPPAPRPAPVNPEPAEPAEPALDYSFLDDEEQAPPEGSELGRRLADAYRSGAGGGSYGGRRFTPRERSPLGVSAQERPAVATLRHLMNAQEAFYRRHERYATLSELLRQRYAALDVSPGGDSFTRRGYRFELLVEADGFRVRAMPSARGPRPFVGDDTGFIRVGTE